MKKYLASLLAIITVCFMTVAFAACADEPSGGGNNGETDTPVTYTVTAEEWDNALDDLANIITINGFSKNLTCEATDGYTKETSMFDNVNKVIKIQSGTSIRFISNDFIYNNYGEELEWRKFESYWDDEGYVEMFNYSLIPYMQIIVNVGIGHFSKAEYKSDKKEYSLIFSKEELEQFSMPDNATVTIQFKNKNVEKFKIAFVEHGTISFEFSDYGTTTVTIPQEVIDNAVSSN